MPRAVSRFGRVRGFAINSTAGKQSAGARDGGGGSAPSGRPMPTTLTIRRACSAPGRMGKVGTGGRGDRSTRGMRKGTARSKRERDRRRSAAKASDLAKMDSIGTFSTVPSGTYLLVPQGEEDLAKMDSIIVEITLLPKG